MEHVCQEIAQVTNTMLEQPCTAITIESKDIEARMKIEIRDIGIPPRPSILGQIEKETLKDAPDFVSLAKLIGSDVGLAAGLIKTANSPFFGFGKKVRTVQEALLVLGLKLVVQTIAGLSLRQMFNHLPQMERFWDTSANTARVAGWLAKQLKKDSKIRPEDAYTFALFRDCGIPVLIAPFPEYLSILTEANAEKELSFTDIENRYMPLNHAVVGSELVESWLLPEDIIDAVRFHHDLSIISQQQQTQKIQPQSLALIAIAQLAEYIVQKQTQMAQNHEWEKLGTTSLSILGLSEEQFETLLNDGLEFMSAE